MLFGTAFFLKHMFLASLFAPEGGWAKKIAGFLLEVGTLGTLDYQVFAPATGYISFFTLALYVGGLMLLDPSPEPEGADTRSLIRAYHNLPAIERATVRQAIAGQTPVQTSTPQEALVKIEDVEITGELVDGAPEETLVIEREKGRG